jgi:CspA family cold shock protein
VTVPGVFYRFLERKIGMEKGTVKFFNATKGFGFITTDGGEEIFFHKSNVKNTGFRAQLVQGDNVEFELKVEQKGKRAFNINRV